MWYIHQEPSNLLPHTESGQKPLGFLVKQAELCPLNILNSLVTPPQLIIGVVPAIMLDISVLSQQLVCCSLLEPLASEGNHLARLQTFAKDIFISANLPGLQLQSVERNKSCRV